MSETEFELLDELYFVQHYSYLKGTLKWEDEKILDTLKSLHDQGLVKCLRTPDQEIFGKVNFMEEGVSLYYLATKKGLMVHNTI
jgi:hypothetical protein